MTGDPLLDLVHMLVRVIEVVGITVIVLGAVIALFRFGRESWPGATGDRGVHGLRSDLGKAILLGLEFLVAADIRSEEHTSELQSLMRISYAVFCLKKKIHKHHTI